MPAATKRRPSAEQCRAGLRKAAERRAELRRELEEVDGEIADWAIRSKGILPVQEIAELAGLKTRRAIYNLIEWAAVPPKVVDRIHGPALPEALSTHSRARGMRSSTAEPPRTSGDAGAGRARPRRLFGWATLHLLHPCLAPPALAGRTREL